MELDFFRKSPVIHNTLFADQFIFAGEDLFGGVALEESVNAGEDLTIGSCVMSSIEFQLENLNTVINDLTGTELTWKQSVETGRREYQSLARASRGNPICVHGAVAYVCNALGPYLSIWNAESNTKIKDAASQPAKPVKAVAMVGDALYCLHEEEPYVTAYRISGQDLAPIAAPGLNGFFQNKIRYLCRYRYAVNAQENILKRYKVDLRDLRPDNLIETAYEYIQMGVFLAEKPEKVNDTRIRVKCYDRLSRLDRYVDSWLDGLAYPLTLKAMLQRLCSYAGVPYLDTAFPNQDYLIQRNFTGDNVSGLQVLRWIAEIAARFGRMDELGRFSLGWYREQPFVVDSKVFASVEVEDYVTAKIEKVQAKSTENDIGVIVPPNAPEAANTLVLTSNPLLYAESDAELRPVVENIYNAVKGITYQPYSVAMRWEVPLLRAGMVVTLTTGKGQTFPAYIMSRSLRSAADSYEATGNERRETQSNEVNQSIQRLRGQTNELTITIDETNSRLTDTEKNLKSEISQTAAQIRTEVSDGDEALHSEITQTASAIRQEVSDGDAGLNSKIDQTAETIRQEVSKADGEIISSVSKVEQTASKINWLVKSGTSASDFTMTDRTISLVADSINMSGFVTFTNLTDGETTISGSNIKTGSISANRVSGGTLEGVTLVSEGNTANVIIEEGRVVFSPDSVPGGELDTSIYGAYRGSSIGDLYLDALKGNILLTAGNPDELYMFQLKSSGNHSLEGSLHIQRDLTVDGHKNCVQSTVNYGKRLLDAYEMPTAYFGDLGEAKVENGVCRIELDPIFLECVNTDVSYQVFLSQYGEGTIYVGERSATAFTVYGDNIPFGWEIKAKRRGYENKRLELFESEERNGHPNQRAQAGRA